MRRKRCAHCSRTHTGRTTCRLCHYCRRINYTLRDMAMRYVQFAQRFGQLKAPRHFSCVDCGAPATRYDHRDYLKPLKVSPVCAKCNSRRGLALPLSRKRKLQT